MATLTARPGPVHHLVQRVLTSLIMALGAAFHFIAMLARASEAQTLMAASEDELAVRGLTRQRIIDYIIDGAPLG